MTRYVVGVDGGNTKSHYALFDTEGRLVRFLDRGPVCHQTLPGGIEAVGRELRAAVDALLTPGGLSPQSVARAVFGLAGADTEDHRRALGSILADLGFGNFRVVNDAFLGIKAGSSRGWGICSINGTGTVTAAVGPDGASVQVGGLGYFTGDEGGGGYLAERVLRAVYDARYRCGPPTRLTELLLGELGLADVEELILAQVESRVPVLKACEAAFLAASLGDGPALATLEAIAKNSVESALGAFGQLRVPDGEFVEFVLAGSLFVKARPPILVDAYRLALQRALGDRARVVLLRVPPVSGAVLWALEDWSAPVSPCLRERIMKALDKAGEGGPSSTP
jgi:N-acetylglucosamine kinase-like BadF-type ATPase